MQLRGYFHPPFNPRITGFNKEGGQFWIGFMDDDENTDGMIVVELTVWADDSPTKSTFANLRAHYDGIKVLRELEDVGFLAIFEDIKASNFYDVAQCCARCNIGIMYHGGEFTKEMTPRKMYELLYADGTEL